MDSHTHCLYSDLVGNCLLKCLCLQNLAFLHVYQGPIKVAIFHIIILKEVSGQHPFTQNIRAQA